MISSYIICGTPRSGSTLLCDLLTGTQVAGKPASFYRRQSIHSWAERLGIPAHERQDGPEFDRAYLAAVLREGRGDAPVFGLRLMRENAPELIARLQGLFPDTVGDLALLERAFGQIAFIHLYREDKVAQAVSLVRALKSGLWHLGADGTERERTAPHQDPVYDEALIARNVAELEAYDRGWVEWFDAQGIVPTRLSYEELSANPASGLAKVLAAIGQDPGIAASVKPRTARMSDAESREWVSRFRTATSGV